MSHFRITSHQFRIREKHRRDGSRYFTPLSSKVQNGRNPPPVHSSISPGFQAAARQKKPGRRA
jgi:hypothetical protein